MNVFVLVAGPPGSGKTTLAGPLAKKLGLSLIAKDAIKEVLMETLGLPTSVEESRALGRAAVETMVTVAQTAPGAVLDSNFAKYSFPMLELLPGTLIEVRCCVPRHVALARYRERTAHHHASHLDRLREETEIWNEELLTPLWLGSVIEIDTTLPVDIDAVAQTSLRSRLRPDHFVWRLCAPAGCLSCSCWRWLRLTPQRVEPSRSPCVRAVALTRLTKTLLLVLRERSRRPSLLEHPSTSGPPWRLGCRSHQFQRTARLTPSDALFTG
jgi:predicted kinase